MVLVLNGLGVGSDDDEVDASVCGCVVTISGVDGNDDDGDCDGNSRSMCGVGGL